jgi:hypothetical protein
MLRRKELNAIALDYSRNTLSKQIFNQYQGIVQCGLFKGLLVGDLGFWDGGGDAGAKILGIYEQQVLDTFSKMNRFRTLVNLGAADGYYGFGLIFAKKCENVIFFETSHESRLEIEKMNKNYGNIFWRIILVFKASPSKNGVFTFFVKFILRILKIGHFYTF